MFIKLTLILYHIVPAVRHVRTFLVPVGFFQSLSGSGKFQIQLWTTENFKFKFIQQLDKNFLKHKLFFLQGYHSKLQQGDRD